MILCDLGGQEVYFGGPGAHFEDFWDCCEFGSVSATKNYLHFEAEMQPQTYFLECCVFDVFWSARFFFVISSALRLHFGSHSVWQPRAFEKTSKSIENNSFCGGLAP